MDKIDNEKLVINTLDKYPFFLAENEDGKILGYVYGSELRPHDAYQWNVSNFTSM